MSKHLLELAEKCAVEADYQHSLIPNAAHEMRRESLRQLRDLLREAATQLRAAATEGGDGIPDAWMHTLNMEGGQTTANLTFRKKHNFGRRGVDYDPSYTVTSLPLYLHPPTDSGAGRDGERYRALRDAVVAGEGCAFQIFKASERPETAEEMDALCDSAIAGAAGEQV